MLESTQRVVSLTREELYEQVWTTPMTKLARQYDLSDVGLAKICRKLMIPTPPAGYWAKVRNGHAVRRLKLLEMDEAAEKQIRLRLAEPTEQARSLSEVEQLIAAERKSEHPIEVAQTLTSPHPLVERTMRSLKSAKADGEGRCHPKAKGCLAVAISPAMIDRAMRIMDALLKALDARGLKIAPVAESDSYTCVLVRGEMINFGLGENLNRKEQPLTADEKRERMLSSFMRDEPLEYEYFPSGRLCLHIGPCANKSNARRQWNDTDTRKVERSLNSFIAALYQASEDIKVARREQEERQRQWKEKERLRQEAEERRRQEEARIKDLDEKLLAWVKGKEIRELVAAVRARAEQRGELNSPDSDLTQWLAWAEQRADRIDPVVSGKVFTMKVDPYRWAQA